jgi:cytochrome c2
VALTDKPRAPVVVALLSATVLFWVASAFAQADVANGRIVFNQKCANCHTMATEPAHGPKGPNLMGVIGRTAGTIEGWDFSSALRASGVVWTEENLNKWLTDPDAFVPGSQMPLKVPIRFEREDVIAYMRSAQATTGGK